MNEVQIKAIARAICEAERLPPDALISNPDYVDGLRGGSHPEVPQWEAKIPEARKFLMMHAALNQSKVSEPFMLDNSSLDREKTLG